MDDFIETKGYILKSAENKRNTMAKTSADIETNTTMKDEPVDYSNLLVGPV